MRLGIPEAAFSRIAQAVEPELTFQSGGDVVGSDQYNGWIAAFDSKDGTGLGYLDYTVYQDEYQISMITVKPEYQGKGIAEKLIRELLSREEIPYSELDWGWVTEEGAALKESLDRKFGQ